MIDRNRVRQQFADYTAAYDTADEKIKLKIEHTYRVADLCEQIVRAEGLSSYDIDFAWLSGMLHDVGRFEQLRQYGTFSDADSIDHALLGVQILFGTEAGQGRIRDYVDELDMDMVKEDERNEVICTEDERIEAVIRYHSAYRLPEHLDARTRLFCNILRDADKIDILKVNVDVPLEAIYNTTTEELRTCAVTDTVMQAYYEEQAILRALKRVPVDNVVSHIALVYELVFPVSITIVQQQGYLDKLLHFESENSITQAQFEQLRTYMEGYLARRQAIRK